MERPAFQRRQWRSGYYHHAEAARSLSLRGTSGEGWGEGQLPSNWRGELESLSLILSPLLRRGERESTSGMVVVSRYARAGVNVP